MVVVAMDNIAIDFYCQINNLQCDTNNLCIIFKVNKVIGPLNQCEVYLLCKRLLIMLGIKTVTYAFMTVRTF